MSTEKRLIRYDGLKQEIIDFKKGLNPKNTDYATGYFSALSVVEGMMVQHIAEDVVEVVRCKNCIYFHKRLGMGFGRCRKTSIYPYEEDFCSYGEKK